MPARRSADPKRSVLEVDWPLFGELSRALALRVARDYEPEIILGVAIAGVVPGAAIAAMLQREFHSILVSRHLYADETRDSPAVLRDAPAAVLDRRVLIVDETCDSGDTLRLAVAAVLSAGAREVRTAVSFRGGPFVPDYAAMETESEIILPWDREIVVGGELRRNPKYE